MPQRKKVRPEGAGVFHPTEGDVRPVAFVPVGGKLLKVRLAGGVPIKELTEDEYCGKQKS